MAVAPLYFEKITHAVASYHHFTATAIRYFGVSGWPKEKVRKSSSVSTR